MLKKNFKCNYKLYNKHAMTYKVFIHIYSIESNISKYRSEQDNVPFPKVNVETKSLQIQKTCNKWNLISSRP